MKGIDKIIFKAEGKQILRRMWRKSVRSPLGKYWREAAYQHRWTWPWAWFWFRMDYPRVSPELADFLGPALGTFWHAPRGDT